MLMVTFFVYINYKLKTDDQFIFNYTIRLTEPYLSLIAIMLTIRSLQEFSMD